MKVCQYFMEGLLHYIIFCIKYNVSTLSYIFIDFMIHIAPFGVKLCFFFAMMIIHISYLFPFQENMIPLSNNISNLLAL